MKAITICQPYAHLIIHGYRQNATGKVLCKDLENRKWPTSYRGPLLIHAGKSLNYVWDTGEYPGLDAKEFKYGCIIGMVSMVDCLPSTHPRIQDNPWREGPWCHVYRGPIAFAEPVPARGALGLWNYPDDHEVIEQGGQYWFVPREPNQCVQ